MLDEHGRFVCVSYEDGCAILAAMRVTKRIFLEGVSLFWGQHEEAELVVVQPAFGATALFYPFENKSVFAYDAK